MDMRFHYPSVSMPSVICMQFFLSKFLVEYVAVRAENLWLDHVGLADQVCLYITRQRTSILGAASVGEISEPVWPCSGDWKISICMSYCECSNYRFWIDKSSIYLTTGINVR